MSTTTEENDDIMEGGIDSSRVFTEALVDQVNKHDVMSMVDLQTEMQVSFYRLNSSLTSRSSIECVCVISKYEVRKLGVGSMRPLPFQLVTVQRKR